MNINRNAFVLRNITEEEAREIVAWRYDGVYSVYNYPSYEECQSKGFTITDNDERKYYYLGVFLDGKLFGFYNINEYKSSVELGFGIRPDMCGKGYGKAFVELGINEVWKMFPEASLVLRVRPWNIRAIKCYESVGFRIVYKYFESEYITPGDMYVMVKYPIVVPAHKPIDNFIIKELSGDEINEALTLALDVFMDFEAPIYSEEGVNEFKMCLHNPDYLNGISYLGAYIGEKLVGIIGVRNLGNHICFFFVRKEYQRMGVGKRLFEALKIYMREANCITLNASPYGIPFYKALGFQSNDCEKTINGIRFTPMWFTGKYYD